MHRAGGMYLFSYRKDTCKLKSGFKPEVKPGFKEGAGNLCVRVATPHGARVESVLYEEGSA